MSISLTKEQILKRFKQRQSQFSDAIGKQLKPELPCTVESYDDLAGKCSQVVIAFLEVVFTEDTE
ncbi:hypothetical protein ACFLVG_01405 [Chloroflexota bacterium]